MTFKVKRQNTIHPMILISQLQEVNALKELNYKLKFSTDFIKNKVLMKSDSLYKMLC